MTDGLTDHNAALPQGFLPTADQVVVTGRGTEYGVEDVEMTDLRVEGRKLAPDAMGQDGFVSGLAVL